MSSRNYDVSQLPGIYFFLEIAIGQPHEVSGQVQVDRQPKPQWLKPSGFLELFSVELPPLSCSASQILATLISSSTDSTHRDCPA